MAAIALASISLVYMNASWFSISITWCASICLLLMLIAVHISARLVKPIFKCYVHEPIFWHSISCEISTYLIEITFVQLNRLVRVALLLEWKLLMKHWVGLLMEDSVATKIQQLQVVVATTLLRWMTFYFSNMFCCQNMAFMFCCQNKHGLDNSFWVSV